jgi:hypothetical protein
MKIPRFSIAASMGLVALVAVDFATISAAVRARDSFPLTIVCLGALPMATILAVGLGLRIARARRGEHTDGLTAFLVIGGLEAATFLASLLVFPTITMAFHERTIVAVWFSILERTRLIGSDPVYRLAFGIAFYVTYFTIPQLVVAWLTGLAYRNHRRRMRRPPDLVGVPAGEGA